MNKNLCFIIFSAFFMLSCLTVGGDSNIDGQDKNDKERGGTSSGSLGGSSSGSSTGSSSGVTSSSSSGASSSGSSGGGTHGSSGTFATSLTCVDSPDQSFPEQNSTCFGIQTCGPLGVCVLCLKPCIGESYVECDPNEIPHYEAVESSCNDQLDNDCDGNSDCADSDCLNQPHCVCKEEDAPFYQSGPETLCDDGHDNDCDGKLDCLDEDCVNADECKQGCEFTAGELTTEEIMNLRQVQDQGKIILQYTFDDETANDSSGNSFHGDEHNVDYAQGQFGKSAKFNGTNSYIEVPWKGQIKDFSGKSFTFDVWFKTEGNDTIPQDGEFRPLYHDSQAFIGNNFDHGAMVGITHSDNGKAGFIAQAPSEASYHTNDVEFTNYSAVYPDKIDDNQWHHVAGVKDVELGQARIYLDGKCLVETQSKKGVDSITPDAAYYIGATHISLNESSEDISHFKGLIDEVIISDYAKSTQEVQRYYFEKIGVIP